MRRAFALALGLGLLVALLAVVAVSIGSPPRQALGWLFLGVVGGAGVAAWAVFAFALREVVIQRFGHGEAGARALR
jgi:hypothetical protein